MSTKSIGSEVSSRYKNSCHLVQPFAYSKFYALMPIFSYRFDSDNQLRPILFLSEPEITEPEMR